MTLEEFAELTGHTQILTVDAKQDVYVFIATREKLKSLKFMTSDRCMRNVNTVRRFTDCNSMRDCGHTMHAVDIQTTVGIWLTGIGLYGGEQGSTHDISLLVLKARRKLSRTSRTIKSDGSKTPIIFGLSKPLYIIANNRYTVCVSMKGPKTWSGEGGVGTCDLFGEGAYIAFYDCEHRCRHSNENSSDSSRSQSFTAYQILYKYSVVDQLVCSGPLVCFASHLDELGKTSFNVIDFIRLTYSAAV